MPFIALQQSDSFDEMMFTVLDAVQEAQPLPSQPQLQLQPQTQQQPPITATSIGTEIGHFQRPSDGDDDPAHPAPPHTSMMTVSIHGDLDSFDEAVLKQRLCHIQHLQREHITVMHAPSSAKRRRFEIGHSGRSNTVFVQVDVDRRGYMQLVGVAEAAGADSSGSSSDSGSVHSPTPSETASETPSDCDLAVEFAED